LEKISREKIGRKGADHINKVKDQLLELTPERIDTVREAFQHMLSICDGAEARDDHGFNKPHACVARWCLDAGLSQEGDVALAYSLLVHYPRQLKDKYPLLFADKDAQ
jgi:hypothetical protein